MDDALLTRPYYRSTYVIVTRADRGLKIESLYDPGLKDLRIGLHIVEDDYAPPGHLLAAQGLSSQIVGYSLYGAYGETNPPARLIDAVAKNEVDLAIVWGPFAGYFAKKTPIHLAIRPVSPDPVPDDPVYLFDRCRGSQRGCRSSICDSTGSRQGVPKNSSARERVRISVASGGCPVMRYVAIGCCLLTLIACKRERRDVRPSPAVSGILGDAGAESALFPGGGTRQQEVRNPYEGNAYAISEGQRLFNWYNCSGCHANGGGGIGPPLIKKDQRDWIYGGEPSNIFDTIVKGRPNGMPTWGGKIPEYQVWQIVTYVRSLNNLEPKAATPARSDSLEQKTGDHSSGQGWSNTSRWSSASMNQSMWHASGSNAVHIRELAVFFGILLSAIFLIVVGVALLSLGDGIAAFSRSRLRDRISLRPGPRPSLRTVVGIATGLTVLILFGLDYRQRFGRQDRIGVGCAGREPGYRSNRYAVVVEDALLERRSKPHSPNRQ